MVVLFGAVVILFRIPHHYAQPPVQANLIADLSDRIVFVDERADGGETLEIVIDHPPTYMANILADLGESAVVTTRGLQQHFPDLRAQKVRFVIQRHSKSIERVVLQDRMVAIEFDRALLMRLQLNEDFPFRSCSICRQTSFSEPEKMKLSFAHSAQTKFQPCSSFLR